MGDIRNISRRWIAVGGSIGLLAGAPGALAEPPVDDDAPDATISASDAPVSTPPATAPAAAAAPVPLDSERAPAVPLTRAAAQERIDHMSPHAWLASYGPVVVGRPD